MIQTLWHFSSGAFYGKSLTEFGKKFTRKNGGRKTDTQAIMVKPKTPIQRLLI